MSSPLLKIAKEILFRNRDQHAIPVMDGHMSPNEGLERCDEIATFDDHPDDTAISQSGAVYVSVGRNILRAQAAAAKSWELFAALPGLAGGLCLHPDGRLLVCVSGNGVAAISKDGAITWLREAGGRPIHCATAIAAARDGTIFITEGSATHLAEDWTVDLLEKNTTGRLIRCDGDFGNAQTLRADLAFPNGCVLSDDERDVIYSEAWAHTITQCDRSGGGVRKIVRNLPGYPARISSNGDGTYWLSIFSMRTHLLELVLDDPVFRTDMMSQIDRRYWIAPTLRALGSYMEPLQGGGIKKLGIIKPWAPPRSYGLVVRIDGDGEVFESYHSRVGGTCHGVTSARRVDDRLLIVSKGHQRLLARNMEAVQ